MKKLLLVIFTLMSAMMLCAAVAGAETYEDYEYTVNDDGTVKITRYTGSEDSVYIPYEIDGKTVTEIGGGCFNECKTLTYVVIREGVTEIGAHAFRDCSALEWIEIPKSVTSIGTGAFSNCSELTSVDIPEGVKVIESGIFSDCISLSSVTIPEGVEIIKYASFYNCESLKFLSIPASVLRIEDTGMGRYKNGNYIYLFHVGCYTGSVGERYAKAYGLDYTLDGRGSVGEGDFDYLIIDEETISILGYNGENKDMVIPREIDGRTVVEISENAFYGSDITSAVIPDSVRYIGSGTFAFCEQLKSVTIPKTVTEMGDAVFSHCYSLEKVNMPASLTIPGHMFFCCESLKEITIGSDVISPFAFSGCTALEKVILSDNVTSIKENAFSGCVLLKEITLPDSLTELQSWAFNGCTSLETIRLPKNLTVKNLGRVFDYDYIISPFEKCTSLETIEVDPENKELYSIDGVVFATEENAILLYPEGKKDAVYKIPDGTKTIGEFSNFGYSVFEYNEHLEKIILPKSVTAIGDRAFASLQGEKCIEFPSGMIDNIRISQSAFNQSPDIIIRCVENSAAYRYAAMHRKNYELFEDDSEGLFVPIIIVISVITILLIIVAIIIIKKRKRKLKSK
ncbi:MAG: leucine-rich repeat domain-containing protein [Ruminococcaceae bacterium]|nr:leucine-rich repeat domain-containing protein [Oscillospiraceae bacterium]